MCEHCGPKCKPEEEMTEKKARKQFNVLRVMAPHMDKNMRPEIQLQNINECPLKGDGMCCRCERFRGMILPEGTIFAHGVYEGFCDTKDKVALKVERKTW